MSDGGIRRRVTSNFTPVPNDVITIKSGLSIEARWLLIYLLSRPQDWIVYIKDIQNQSGVGRDKAQRMLRELVDARWVRKSIERGEDGKWSKVDYEVFDQPEGQEISTSPQPEKPSPVLPSPENQSLTKDGIIPKTEDTKPTAADAALDEEFREFWAAYPRRSPHSNPRAPARAKYILARRKGVPHETLVKAVKVYADLMRGKDPQFVKTAEVWFNKRCWEEFEDQAATTGEPGGVSLESVNSIMASYPGTHGGTERVRAAINAQGSGPEVAQITTAAQMFALLVKRERADGFERHIPPLEDFIAFKWRDILRSYEFCRVGMNNKLSVRPRKGSSHEDGARIAG